MSWLNLNDSLNSIKGQLTNFASGVLAEVTETENEVLPVIKNNVEDLESPQLQQQQHTNNEEARHLQAENATENWLWDPPGEPHNTNQTTDDDVISNLQKKINILESEKKELFVSLEQLDLDCQQTTEKLVTLKSNLQTDYNDLKNNYEKLQKEYGEVLNENMVKSKEIEKLKACSPGGENEKVEELERNFELEEKRLREENHQLKLELEQLKNENIRMSKEIEDMKQTDEELKKFDDDRQILILKNNKLNEETDECKKTIEDLNSENEKIIEENKHLFSELDKVKEQNNILIETKTHLENLQLEHTKLKNIMEDSKHKNEEIQNKNKELVEEILKLNKEHDVNNSNSQKEQLHKKYLNILTEAMHKYINFDVTSAIMLGDDIDTDAASKIFFDNTHHEEPQIIEFIRRVATLVKILLDHKIKAESLEKDICTITREKNNVITQKNFEIEKLLKNSEILSQEVITKTQTIKDYEDECGELMKNNDVLIGELQNYKNSGGLQTISESNEDNLLLLESQLENANKRIQDLELIISDLENSKQDVNLETQTELDYIKKQLNMTGQELNHSKQEHQNLFLLHTNLQEEKHNLKLSLDKLKTEYENMEYKYTELNVNMEALKEENEEHKGDYKKLEHLQNIVDDLQQELRVESENNKQKEFETQNLLEKLQNSKMHETKLKLQVDTISKELQTALEAKQALEMKYSQNINKTDELEKELLKIKNKYNNIGTLLEDEEDREDSNDGIIYNLRSQLENVNKEKDFIQFECTELKKTLSEITQQNDELQQKLGHFELQINEVTTSRNEIIALVTAKHQENVQYHNEIQRLNHLLATETEKAIELESQLHKLSSEVSPSSVNLQEELLQKAQEIEKVTDQNNFLREKCEVLAQNLLQEQSSLQKTISERTLALEKEQSLSKELERLRAHLVEIEEIYTQELLQAEQKNKEMQAKVNEIEQREKDSSSIYTSVSIRANQQVETLQAQLQLVTNQREDLRMKVSDLEDQNNKQVAALMNLQLVLEQFQKEREKDVQQETERVRRQITVEKRKQQTLHDDISNLKAQLEESKQGLQAASRLSDQLEKSKQQIGSLKDEVSKLQDQLKSSETKYKELSTQGDIKVDKTLIKNLIIGYITSSHSADQNQILKIIATVLDFDQKESDKVNLNKLQQGGWLNAILHPQNLNSNQPMSQQSLSEAFVRFLENESKPKVLPNLLISTQGRRNEGGSSSSTTPRQSPSPLVLSEVVLPTFVDFGKSRNSSSILKDVLKDNS